MKNLLQFILLLTLTCAVIWFVGTRIANLEEKENQLSSYQIYDPFKEETEAAVSDEPGTTPKQTELVGQLPTDSPAPTQEVVAVVEDDLSQIELKVSYDKLAANISRTNVSSIFFTKSETVCSLENNFNSIYDSLKKSAVDEVLLTIEPLLPKSDDFNPSKAKIALKALPRDNILNINFPNSGRPTLVGIYLCSDKENSGSCANKGAYTASSAENSAIFFAYAYFDLESFSLLTFPAELRDKYVDKFSRTNFGPIDKSNLAYRNSKTLISNLSSPIRLKSSSSSIAFHFPLYQPENCAITDAVSLATVPVDKKNDGEKRE